MERVEFVDDEFVPHYESLQLKKLGFDMPCIAHFRGFDCEPTTQMGFAFKTEKNSDFGDGIYWVARPTFATAFRWFREKHGLHGNPLPTSFEILDNEYSEWGCTVEVYPLSSYEEAELACLKKLIEIVKLIENEKIELDSNN